MRRKSVLVRVLLTLFALVTMSSTAGAHDSWIQPNVGVAEVGERVYLDLYLGNHSNEHRSYRIAAKLDPEATTLKVYRPDGVVADYSDTLVDYGEPDATPPAGVKGYLGTAFRPDVEGLYLAVASFEDILQHGDGPKFRSFRTSKTYVAAVQGTREKALQLSGWDHVVAPSGAELVAQQNPATVAAGDAVRFRLLLRGEPIAGEHVTMIRRGTSEYWEAVSDSQGLVIFPVPADDYYLVRAKIDREGEALEGQYAKTSYEATFTFVADSIGSRRR